MWVVFDGVKAVFVTLLLFAVAFAVDGGPAAAKDGNRLVIASGAVAGGYYVLGGAICAGLGADAPTLRCAVEPSKGTMANLASLGGGAVDLALIQSDWQHHAHAGSVAQFAGDKALKDMRAIASLNGSPLVVLTPAKSDIGSIEDLADKRVDIGKRGVGRRAAMDDLLAALGWDLGKFKLASELTEADAIQALCGGRLDALALAGATPDRGVAQALRTCPLKFVTVAGAVITKLIQDKPYYSAVNIPANSYAGIKTEVPGVGVRVILLATSKLPEKDAYALAKSIAGDVDALRKLHPSFASITRAGLAKDSISVPLHDGAARFYKEAKLK